MSQNEHGSDGGSFIRDAGTRTGRAVVLIVVAAVVAFLLLHHTVSTRAVATVTTTTTPTTTTVPTSTSTATTVPTVSPTTVAVSAVKLQVLNGASPTLPLAGEFTAKLKASPGYDTLTANNATAQVKSSVIYVYAAGFTPEADALATSLGLASSAVVATVPATAPIPASTKTLGPDLVLVVGPDLKSKA